MTELDVRVSSHPRFQLEIGLVKMAHARRLEPIEEALARLNALQDQLSSMGVLPSPSSTEPQRGPRSAAPQPKTSAPAAARPAQTSRSNKSAAAATPSPPPDDYDEPPPLEPPDEEMRPVRATPPTSGGSDVERLKQALESKRKMMIVSALDKAETIRLDGDILSITFEPANKIFRSNVESREGRKSLEEACHEVFGRRITLSISGPSGAKPSPARSPGKATGAEDHPLVRKLVEEFHGTVVEVIEPES